MCEVPLSLVMYYREGTFVRSREYTRIIVGVRPYNRKCKLKILIKRLQYFDIYEYMCVYFGDKKKDCWLMYRSRLSAFLR